jgi:hypothetical protein
MGLSKSNHNFNYPATPYAESVGALNAGSLVATSGSIGNLTATLTNPVFSGQSLENFYINLVGFAGGYIFYAASNGAIQYSVNTATSNGALSITASPTQTLNAFMAVGQVMTITLMITNGATAYYPTSYVIDGVAYTPKWSGGTAPSGGNANSTDFYTLSIFKASVNGFVIFGSQTKNA